MANKGANRTDVHNADQVVAAITSSLGEQLLSVRRPLANRVYLEIEPSVIQEVARIISIDLHARLQTASAVDAPKLMEILYHWAFDSVGMVVSVRTRIDREQPEIASIAEICPAAEWIEREMWELMGIVFRGHPDLRHLLLQDDWPERKYPLRRDYRRD